MLFYRSWTWYWVLVAKTSRLFWQLMYAFLTSLPTFVLTFTECRGGGGNTAFRTQTLCPFGVGRIPMVSFYQWPYVQDTGAPTIHGKPGSLTCPVQITNTREHFSWEEPVHISFLVILVEVRGIELAIPGSAIKCFTTESNPLAFFAYPIFQHYVSRGYALWARHATVKKFQFIFTKETQYIHIMCRSCKSQIQRHVQSSVRHVRFIMRND